MSLASLVAGSLIGFLVTLYPVSSPYRLTVGIITGIGIIILLLVAVGAIQRRYRNLRLRLRWQFKVSIGILSDSGWDLNNPNIFSWTDISPDDWKARLEFYAKEANLNVKVKTITSKSRLDTYAAILNPYGAVYPEQDLKNLETYNLLISFVRDGGVVVNVADIPFYYAYNKNLKRRQDTTEPSTAPILQGNQVSFATARLFDMSIFCKDLGIRILNVESAHLTTDLFPILGRHVSVNYERATISESNIVSCVEPMQVSFSDGTKGHLTPFFYAGYGDGDFLVSLIFINTPANPNTNREAVRDAICKSTINKLQEIKKKRTAG